MPALQRTTTANAGHAAFRGLPDDRAWFADVSASGLIGAGLHALARLLKS